MSKNLNPWKVKSSQEIYDNPWINVVEDKVINPVGNDGIYTTVNFKNYAIGIIPLDQELNTWIVGQYRYPLNIYSWEIPMGGGPLEDKILDSAKRELLEEAGLTAKTWENILTIHTSNAVCNEEGYVFIATDLTEGESQPEETEVLELKKLPFIDVYDMAMNGEITDSLSLAGIFKTYTLLKQKGVL